MALGMREPEETSAKAAATVRTILRIGFHSSRLPTKSSQCYIAALEMQTATIGASNGAGVIAEICCELATPKAAQFRTVPRRQLPGIFARATSRALFGSRLLIDRRSDGGAECFAIAPSRLELTAHQAEGKLKLTPSRCCGSCRQERDLKGHAGRRPVARMTARKRLALECALVLRSLGSHLPQQRGRSCLFAIDACISLKRSYNDSTFVTAITLSRQRAR
jgi:hypothetical protein